MSVVPETTLALKIFLIAPNSHEVWLYFGFFFKKVPNISIWVIFTVQVNIISISPLLYNHIKWGSLCIYFHLNILSGLAE